MSARCAGVASILFVLAAAPACGEQELALNPVPFDAGGGGGRPGSAAGGTPTAAAGHGGRSSLSAGGAAGTSAEQAGESALGMGGDASGSLGGECVSNVECKDERPRCLTARQVCVECLQTPDCPSLADVCDAVTRTCTHPCQTSNDCKSDDVPWCAPREVCVECLLDADCQGDRRCDIVTNRCRECVTDGDCALGARCNRTSGECEGPK